MYNYTVIYISMAGTFLSISWTDSSVFTIVPLLLICIMVATSTARCTCLPLALITTSSCLYDIPSAMRIKWGNSSCLETSSVLSIF